MFDRLITADAKQGQSRVQFNKTITSVAIVFRHQNNGHTGKLQLETFY